VSKYRLWLLLSLAAPLDAAAIDLAAAYAAARLQSPEFAAAQEAVAAAQEGPAVARARLLPQMALQINQNQIRQTTMRTAGKESFAGSAYNHELTFRQALFREKDRLDVQIARLNVEVAELELEKSLSRVWLRVATAWVDEKFSTWRVRTLAEIAGVGESLAASAQKRFSRGESTLDIVAEASARSRLARARLQEAQDERLTAIRALELLIGSPSQTEAENELSFSGQQTDRQALFAPPSTAYFLEHSPAIRALRLNEAIANRRVAKADAEHYPTVDLVGSASRAENDNASALGNTYRTARVGIQASIPLMSGGGRHGVGTAGDPRGQSGATPSGSSGN
jgi:protease secretion system outer membrane protein